MIYLTTAMLGNIFTEKIGSHNSHYKELIHNAFIEDGLDAPQPLDDVGDYIDYINQHTKSIQVIQEKLEVKNQISPFSSTVIHPRSQNLLILTHLRQDPLDHLHRTNGRQLDPKKLRESHLLLLTWRRNQGTRRRLLQRRDFLSQRKQSLKQIGLTVTSKYKSTTRSHLGFFLN